MDTISKDHALRAVILRSVVPGVFCAGKVLSYSSCFVHLCFLYSTTKYILFHVVDMNCLKSIFNYIQVEKFY